MLSTRLRLLDVRPGERRDVLVALATLFVFMCAHGVLETARDALFLARLPATQLPWVYVAMAASGVIVAWLSTRRRAPREGGGRLSMILGASAVVTASLAIPASDAGTALPYVIYVWTGLVATFGTVELWQLLGDHFTADQAKRLYGLIGAGAIAGVVVGSALAAVLSVGFAPGSLLLVAAGLSTLAAGLARHLAPGAGSPLQQRISATRVLRTEPHARKLLYLVLLGSLTLTIANYLFKSYVAGAVPSARLGVVFGWFYATVNAVALLVQVTLTSTILRRLGTVRSIAVLPSVLVAGGAIFLGTPIVPVLVAMKAFDGIARHSILKTAMEILFLPLPRDERHALKALLEALGQRGGQAVASAGILVVTWLRAGPGILAMAVVVLSGIWLLALVDVRQHYVALFQRRLRAGALGAATRSRELDDGEIEAALTFVPMRHGQQVMPPPALLEQLTVATLERAVELLVLRQAVAPLAHSSSACRELVDVLVEEERHALRRLFRVLSLLHPGQLDFIAEGAGSSDPRLRAASHGVIAEVVDARVGERLLVLLDDVDDVGKAARLTAGRPPLSPSDVLPRLEADRSERVRFLAARCHAELRGPALGEFAPCPRFDPRPTRTTDYATFALCAIVGAVSAAVILVAGYALGIGKS